MANYEIYPLITMIMENNEMSMFTYMQNYGRKLKVPVLIWLIQGNGRNILVDSGASDPVWATRYHHPSTQSPDMVPNKLIEKAGITADDIDSLILTHLHWDHCYNLELFPNARIYVQKSEVEYAVSPLPCHELSYEIGLSERQPAWIPHQERMVIKDGDYTLCEGIEIYHLPGHTPGMQSPAVQTENGVYLIASDNIALYLNWEGTGKFQHIPGTIHCNLEDYYKTFEKMERVCDHVLPGHDITLTRVKKIPSV